MKVKTKEGEWFVSSPPAINPWGTLRKETYVGCVANHLYMRDWWPGFEDPRWTIECGDEEFETELAILRMK